MSINYDTYSYGKLFSVCTQEGLALCNEIKLNQQIKKHRLTERQQLGEFCEQFASVKEGVIPSKYFHKTTHRLKNASGGSMSISYKLPRAYLCQQDTCIPESFVLVKDIDREVILGVPFFIKLMPLLYWEKTSPF